MHRFHQVVLLVMLAMTALIFLGGCTSNSTSHSWEQDVQTFEKAFGGNSHDEAYSVQQTRDEGYILGGVTFSAGAGRGDCWLIKTDGHGNIVWDETFGGAHTDRCHAVEQTADDGYIAAGTTLSFGEGFYDIWLIKIDESGGKQWDVTYGGGEWDAANDVQQTSDGGYIVVGDTSSGGEGDLDILLVKFDQAGVFQWENTFGGDGDDFGASVRQTGDGGYVVAGTVHGDGGSGTDLRLLKTDGQGNMEWEEAFGDVDSDGAYSVRETTDDGFIVAGYTHVAARTQIWLIKTDRDGVDELWNTNP